MLYEVITVRVAYHPAGSRNFARGDDERVPGSFFHKEWKVRTIVPGSADSGIW